MARLTKVLLWPVAALTLAAITMFPIMIYRAYEEADS